MRVCSHYKSPALHFTSRGGTMVLCLRRGSFSGGVRPPLTARGGTSTCFWRLIWRETTAQVSACLMEICFPSHEYHETMSSAVLSLLLIKFYYGQSHIKSDVFSPAAPKTHASLVPCLSLCAQSRDKSEYNLLNHRGSQLC